VRTDRQLTRWTRSAWQRTGTSALALLITLGGCSFFEGDRSAAASGKRMAADAVLIAVGADPQDRLPGHAGAVGRDSQIVYSGAAGLADLASGRKVGPTTRFRIYSVSKSIGATSAMLLVESGQLDLDAPISRYLPSLPAALRAITVRQILAHRSGVRHYRSGEWASVSDFNCAAPQQALPDFVNDPLLFEPGSGYQYTTFGYVLLSAVLEAAAGQPFDQLMRERFFQPAGMSATAIEGRPVAGHESASFYDRSDVGEFSPTAGIDASCKYLGGGLVSTAEDLVRFGLALLDGRLVSAESLAQMLSIHSAGSATHPPYGYGFFPGDGVLNTAFGIPLQDMEPAWWHGGSGRGGYAALILYPQQRSAWPSPPMSGPVAGWCAPHTSWHCPFFARLGAPAPQSPTSKPAGPAPAVPAS
jgi:CubicO group peptidase (beta-lactamase class C family)